MKEPRLVSPPSAPKEERMDTFGGEQKTPGVTASKGRGRLCLNCGKPSDDKICRACADKIGADAVEKKRWEQNHRL
jgi:hypothetical protein